MYLDLETEMEKLAQIVASRVDQIRASSPQQPAKSRAVYLSTNVIQFPPERIVRVLVTCNALSKRRPKRP